MDYINPLGAGDRRVVLASLYPFIWDPQSRSYSERALGAALKAECLVQRECTVPGSMVLENPTLGALIEKNADLLKSGALVLDLRSSVKSYRELAKVKHGREVPDEMLRRADFLDETCPRVLHFDPEGSSDKYRKLMKSFLESLRAEMDTGHAMRSLDKLIKYLEKGTGYLTIGEACALVTNITPIDGRINEAARFFYCACGSEFVGGTVQVPQSLWDAVHRGRRVVHVSADDVTASTDLSAAHGAVLDHFALPVEALDRLEASDVVHLRSEGATAQAIAKLEEIADGLRQEYETGGGCSSSKLEELSGYREELVRRVRAYCRKEVQQRIGRETGNLGFDELLALMLNEVPFVGVAKKAVLWGGRTVARKTKVKELDFTLSPVDTYVARVRATVDERS